MGLGKGEVSGVKGDWMTRGGEVTRKRGERGVRRSLDLSRVARVSEHLIKETPRLRTIFSRMTTTTKGIKVLDNCQVGR